jgi:hypothetical protein
MRATSTSPTRAAVLISALAALALATPPQRAHAATKPSIEFDMTVSAGAAACLPDATAHVKVKSLGRVEQMIVDVSGLPPRAEFALFVIQVPTAPFGVSSYLGSIDTNGRGKGKNKFVGRFSIDTFVVAAGVAAAPAVHSGAFPDASTNPSFNPIHTYHLGLWFNSNVDAVAAGCSATLTPFNGEHTAGVQVLNTASFASDHGPLRQLVP